MKRKKTVSFKPYHPHQEVLFPRSLEDFIDKNHPVRVISRIVENLDLRSLYRQYPGGGRSSYHPVMLLKVIVYSYLNNIYSSRKMERALKENVHYMWLSGNQQPDHNTLNRFRSDKLGKVIKEVFTQISHLLLKSGQVSLEEVYLDGTKLEANANRYSFVWGKTIAYNKSRIVSQLEELWSYAKSVTKEESLLANQPDFSQIDSESVEEAIASINAALKGNSVEPSVKRKLSYGKKHWPQKISEYSSQQEKLGDRNSMSKTDEDATFMRMKEDHMHNSELKAGYNLQLMTNNQVVLGYTVTQKLSDTTSLISSLEDFISNYATKPNYLIADAGYGSEENYEYLEKLGIIGLVKYNTFDKQKQLRKKFPFHQEELYYNEKEDYYVCPMGQRMYNVGSKERRSDTNYIKTTTYYQAQNCRGCPLRGLCHKQKGNRRIEVNHRGRHLRLKAKKLLESPEGQRLSRRRKMDVEPVFGNIKQNMGRRRLMLRGMNKVILETGLYCISHNLQKLITFLSDKPLLKTA